MATVRRPKATEERALISTTSILILSGFLIGVTVGKLVADDLSPYVLACGLAGLLAYIALDIAATRREEEAAEEEIRYMHGRLDRHVMSINSAGNGSVPPLSQDPDPPSLDAILLNLSAVTGTQHSITGDTVQSQS